MIGTLAFIKYLLKYNRGNAAYMTFCLAHEMNGNWYPWSAAMGNSTPQDYISAWRHIHDIFSNKSLDSTRLQWVWCVNNADVGSYTAENYWVGDSYVDWIGVDGYNWGATQSWSVWSWPNQIFDNMIQRLRLLSPTKPLCLGEYATTSIRITNVSDVVSKNNWLNDFCTYINTTQIQMAIYFNIDKETDWAIFGSMNGNMMWNNFSTYTAYKNCLQSNDWVVPDLNNPRIITDEQFAGIGNVIFRLKLFFQTDYFHGSNLMLKDCTSNYTLSR